MRHVFIRSAIIFTAIVYSGSFFAQTAHATINPRFTDNKTREHFDLGFKESNPAEFEMRHIVVYPERNTFYMGEKMRIKYAVRSPFNDAHALKLNIFVTPPTNANYDKLFLYEQVPGYGTSGWNAGGSCIAPNPSKLKPTMTVQLGDIAKGSYVTGMLELPVTAANGFKIKKSAIQNVPQVIIALEDTSRTFYTDEMMQMGITLPCSVSPGGPTVHEKSTIKTNLVVTKFTASKTNLSVVDFENDATVTFTGEVINKGTKQPDYDTTLCVVKRSKTMDAPTEYSSWNDDQPLFDKRCKIIKPAQLKPGKKMNITFKFKVKSDKIRSTFTFGGAFNDPDAGFALGDNRMTLAINEGWEDNFETNYADNTKELIITIK